MSDYETVKLGYLPSNMCTWKWCVEGRCLLASTTHLFVMIIIVLIVIVLIVIFMIIIVLIVIVGWWKQLTAHFLPLVTTSTPGILTHQST